MQPFSQLKLFLLYYINKDLFRSCAGLMKTVFIIFFMPFFDSVQAVVELKNRPTMWHKARKVSLTAGQTEIKIEFPLPIVACNLMIEYADFYENIQGKTIFLAMRTLKNS